MSAVPAPDPRLVAVHRKVAWRIMPLLMICYVAAFIDRANIGFAKLGFLHDLGFDDAVYGVGAGIFYLGYVLLEIPSNLYLRRVGARKTLLRIMVLWGLCCAALAVIAAPLHLYLLRFLLGAAEAGLFHGILLYLTYWTPPQRRARLTALFMAAIPIAGIVGGPLAGLIMHGCDGWLGLHGWQWLFILEGAPAVVLGAVAYVFLADSPTAARWLDPGEKVLLENDLACGSMPAATTPAAPVGHVLRNGSLYRIALFGAALMISTAGAFLWLPTIIHKTGVRDPLQVGLLSALPFIVGVVVQYLVSHSSDRRGERRWHAVVPALAAALGWALLPLAVHSAGLSIALQAVAISGTFAAMGPFWSLPGLLLPPAAAPAGIALVSSIAGLGNFVSPILVGKVTVLTGSLAAGQIYFAALLLIGSAAMLAGPAAGAFIPSPGPRG